MSKISTKDLVSTALFTALISIGAVIKLQLFAIPFTLQLVFVMLAGIVLGAKLGSLSVLIYILLGLAGIPVFSGGGGIQYIFKIQFGYIIGFIFAAMIIGYFAGPKSNSSFIKTLIATVAGLLAVYICGVSYWYFIANYVAGTPIEFIETIKIGALAFLPKDLFFCAVSSSIGIRVRNILTKNYKKNLIKEN